MVCSLDTFLYKTIWKRFDLDDLRTFSGEVGATVDFLHKSALDPSSWWYFLLVICSFFLLFTRQIPRTSSRFGKWWVLSISALLISISLIPVDRYAIAKPHTVNVLMFQWGFRAPAPIAPSRRAELTALAAAESDSSECVEGLNLKPNIILVVMESFSAHHSQLVSGLNNWTPQIDRLAGDQAVWPNFYANGYRTDLGLVALLTGLDPIVSDQEKLSLYDTSRAAQSLPLRLRRHGYKSQFMSGSSLHFLKADQWLKAIGFDVTSDPSLPPDGAFESNKFTAMSDEELYQRTLRQIEFSASPSFTVVNTYSSHMPYRHYVTGERGEAAAFSYADQAFASFYGSLVQRDFFKQGGILLLTGDHRSMSPMSGAEVKKYGASAPARVPFMMFSERLRLDDYILGAFQQADLAPSLEYYAGDTSCFSRRQRNLFAPSIKGLRSIVHVRGDQSRVVSAFGPLGDATISLNSKGAEVGLGALVDESTLLNDISLRRFGWMGAAVR